MEIEHFAIAKYRIANKMARTTPTTIMTVNIGVVARAAAFPTAESKRLKIRRYNIKPPTPISKPIMIPVFADFFPLSLFPLTITASSMLTCLHSARPRRRRAPAGTAHKGGPPRLPLKKIIPSIHICAISRLHSVCASLEPMRPHPGRGGGQKSARKIPPRLRRDFEKSGGKISAC